MKNISIIITLLLTTCIPLITLIFKSYSPKVSVINVNRGTATQAVPGNVTIHSQYEFIIKTLRPGYLAEVTDIPASGSKKVLKGDIIAKQNTEAIDHAIQILDKRRNAVLERQRIGSQTEIHKLSLKEELDYCEELFENELIPESDIARRRHEYERVCRAFENEIVSHLLELELIDLELDAKLRERDEMILKAPMDGLLVAIYQAQDNFLNPNTDVAKIISDKSMVEISISEEDYHGIEIGQAVSIKLLGYPETISASISGLSATTDSNTNKRQVFASLENENLQLTPGMTGQASIIKNKHENALIIPRQSLLGCYVYTVSPKKKIKIKKVEPGFISLSHVEILKGLDEGDQVLLEDMLSLHEGERVRLQLK